MVYLIVFLGSGCGGVCRVLLGDAILKWFPVVPQTGILVVNVLGSYLIGVFSAWVSAHPLHAPEWVRLAFIAGFCGGFTTFSSFSHQTLMLVQSGRHLAALINIFLNVVLCLIATYVGILSLKWR